ncbi:type VI secretion system-associated protein TagF [Sphingomonas mucosissima]|uniref:Type VI secretion system-associated protein TagF n=1 Tax=Sphingomonas mucosissima TaxID=370959 RepID=A0A245ZMK4_9SPHN|nr:type VI secretion system-associated protein TagF [Sphingomonas mucosissima]OWK30977.1 hypothetical protein SPMU_19690 [Sphingomonas mucosissima]
MSAWVFGKLPAHGDFVARGMAAVERVALDDWLSAALLAARDVYGADFEERFDVAQPWRAEGNGVTGALAPSQDSAGRRYPVLLLSSDAEDAEDLLYAAITEGWSADRLAKEAGTAPARPVARWFGHAAERAGERPADLLTAMLA